MDSLDVPHRTFEYLMGGFICNEGADLARFHGESQVANPGDPFGNVFAWLWEHDKDSAVAAFANLLAEARRHGEEGDEVRLDELIKGLRFSLHRSRLAQEDEFWEVERVLKEQVPEHFGGRTDL